jgi:predicted glutamine amidotransferase
MRRRRVAACGHPNNIDTVALMCRLFGMSGGREPVAATFWLLEAPDSLAEQSHREPDGTGLGTFDDHGRPQVAKEPLAAYEDKAFAREARKVRSRTFVAHIRFASTGGLTLENTHPFEQRGRLFAHNGVIGDVPRLEQQLGDARALVKGETDSERFFALITEEIARDSDRSDDGDIGAAITRAARWVAANLPVFALNLILTTPSDLWALRYPDTHELHVLERAAGSGGSHLRSSMSRVQAPDERVVVVASERMDDDPGWRALNSGELLHVDPDLGVTVTRVLDQPPAHPLTLTDLDPRAAASQHP